MIVQPSGMKTKLYSLMPARGTRTTIGLLAIASLLAVAPAGWGVSPSELLEQGVYAEETKGDLDAALKLYRQAVTEAKAGWTAGAQAQFRLGVCYCKKKDSAAATAAFEQLVKDYPEQKELAAQATDHLYRILPLLPAPWVDGEESRFDLKSPGGPKVGLLTITVNAGETNGQKLWLLGSQLSDFLQIEFLHQVEVDAATLRPLHSRYKDRTNGFDTVYRPGSAGVRAEGAAGGNTVNLPGAVYDSDALALLIRRLPLATNYSASLITADLNSTNGERFANTLKVRVAGVESVSVPAGTYECFKVDLSTNGALWDATGWYSTDAHRYLVKFMWAEKEPVWTGELAAINQHRPDEPVRYRDPALGFSLTAPPGWVLDRYTGEGVTAAANFFAKVGPPEEKDKLQDKLLSFNSLFDNPKVEVALRILVPDLTFNSFCEANVSRLEGLNGNATQSPRAWAEEDMARLAKVLHDLNNELHFTTHEWQELKLAGHPAVSAIADSGEGEDKATMYGVWTFDNTNAVKFYFISTSKDFGGARLPFDALVGSYSNERSR
jgi:tetratricopeptide (TPR) repeat protein